MHSTYNRNEFIKIQQRNVKEEQTLFDMKYQSESTDFNPTYDYGSIMHYAPYAYSQNGGSTILNIGGKDENCATCPVSRYSI